MNAQRWLALGFVVLLIACIASSSLWLEPLMGGSESEATATPTVAVAEEDSATPTPAVDTNLLESLAEPTLDPDIAAIMNDMQISELEVGIDPHIIRAGDFAPIDPSHQGHGTASIYWFSDAQQYLRLDNFSVTNGPDLRVILSQQDTPRTSAETLLPSYVDLGPLKSSSGAQNYEIPVTDELSKYKSVVIYSTSLNIVFTSAPLEQVRGQ